MPVERSNNLAIKWLSIFSDSCGIRAQCKEMRCGIFPNSSVYHACVKPQHFLWQNQSLIQNISWLRTLQRRIKTSIFPHINFYLAWVVQSKCEMSGHPRGDLPAKFKEGDVMVSWFTFTSNELEDNKLSIGFQLVYKPLKLSHVHPSPLSESAHV